MILETITALIQVNVNNENGNFCRFTGVRLHTTTLTIVSAKRITNPITGEVFLEFLSTNQFNLIHEL